MVFLWSCDEMETRKHSTDSVSREPPSTFGELAACFAVRRMEARYHERVEWSRDFSRPVERKVFGIVRAAPHSTSFCHGDEVRVSCDPCCCWCGSDVLSRHTARTIQGQDSGEGGLIP